MYTTYIINLLSQAVSCINQFLSALTGKKYFTQAKKAVYDYADSVTKKMKKVKDAILDIDELHIIGTNDEDNGGDSGALEDCYEELAISQEILDFAERLKKLFSELFEPMRKAWEEVWLNGSGYKLCSNILLLLTSMLNWIGNLGQALTFPLRGCAVCGNMDI